MNINKIVGMLLFIAVLPLPIEYYEILRIIVSIAALINIVQERYIFVPVLIIFNPIMPVYLYDKAIWAIIDIVSGLLFWAAGEND